MSTFIPPTPAATKSAEQHEEPSEQDSFNHLLFKVLRLTSEQVQDLNDWMIHRGIPNVHEIIVQSFRRPHALEDDLHFIRENKTCYIKANVMVSLSLMITYIKHLRHSAKATHLDHSTTSRLILKTVEKSVFSFWIDLFLCRSIQLLVLSDAEMFCLHVSFTTYEYFYKLSKGASSSRWFLHSMTRRTSDPTLTHMYLYTHVSQI